MSENNRQQHSLYLIVLTNEVSNEAIYTHNVVLPYVSQDNPFVNDAICHIRVLIRVKCHADEESYPY